MLPQCLKAALLQADPAREQIPADRDERSCRKIYPSTAAQETLEPNADISQKSLTSLPPGQDGIYAIAVRKLFFYFNTQAKAEIRHTHDRKAAEL